MLRWVDAPDWTDETGHTVTSVLTHAFWQVVEIQGLWQAANLDPSQVAWEGRSAALLWPGLLTDAQQAGCLEQLIKAACSRFEEVGRQLEPVLTLPCSTGQWYSSPEPFSARLVGWGSREAVLDRYALRHHLRLIAEGQYPIVAILGDSGSGRSHSRALIRHVAGARRVPLITVDAADLPESACAIHLISRLARELGLSTAFTVDENTSPDRTARELVSEFLGRYSRELGTGERWIWIDSLDHPNVGLDLNAAVGHLALKLVQDLVNLRLIVSGHPGDFAPEVTRNLLEESVKGIDAQDVVHFFEGIAQDLEIELSQSQILELTSEALADAGSLSPLALGRASSRVAHRHFGAVR